MIYGFSQQVVAETIDYLVAHYHEQPDLAQLAERAGYEATYFQKIFSENVGISPKRLIQYMNMRTARQFLAAGYSTLETAGRAGLSSESRLYDLFVSCEAVTPGAIRHKGRGVTVTYGFHPTPLGEMMVAATPRGVCYLGFLVSQNRDVPLRKLQDYLPYATFVASNSDTRDFAVQILKIWSGQGERSKKLRLDLYGTNLQIQVWQALLRIPMGATRTYQQIACDLGRPKAARAIGNAVGANPVSLLIPCHRVIRASGIIDNYGWGSPRKKLLLGLEAEHVAHAV